MRRADAVLLEAAFEAEVEVRRVDADEDVGALLQSTFVYSAPHGQQARQMAQHFDQTHHAQTLGRIPLVEAGCRHLRAAHAAEAGVREARAQAGDEPGAEQIAGTFTGDEDEARAERVRAEDLGVRAEG